jgi:lipoprotein-anchoring transpeptidase ErfK/SrfK
MTFGGQFALCLGAGNLETKSGDAMKALMLGKLVMVIVAAMVLAVQARSQEKAKPEAAARENETKRRIVVSLEDRKLALVEDGQVMKVYSVAVGKPSTPSPVGTFTIERRAANPTYRHNGKTVPPGPGNPVGTRWMGLSKHGYGIHGTNEPNSIGKAASHGCIRMAKADLEEFYELVTVGDTVELVGERNEETAQLFGDQENPAAAAQPVETAMAAPAAAVTAQALDVHGARQANPTVQVLMAAR